ncbi:outer membrane protein TolC [Pseudomonas duriflava]|uniref:Outer membrane protein TolC n=1 Tax=Pseudomonas duriflava TaxID=459528 RepID=A0A562PXW8_9PSED|nr:TolC family protein [Pseudomonas duriflava]TWI49267.1 outer membrane protein TolC [Pseudomonas duriflava]
MIFRRDGKKQPSQTAVAVCLLAVPVFSSALTLDEAIRLAERDAPSMAARQAGIEAARSAAIPAGELPDPKLALGLQNVPIQGEDRFSLNRDSMTMQMVGVTQDVPNRDKRRARVEAAQASVSRAEAVQRVERLNVRIETALAWIEARAIERKLEVFKSLYEENRLLAKAVQARLAGNAGQISDSVVPKQEAALLAEKEDELQRSLQQARADLRRWVGAAADEPLVGNLPFWPVDTRSLTHNLERHPKLAVFDPMTQEAEAQIRQAVAEKKPDWSWQVGYQNRGREYGDMVSLQVSFDLPLFTSSRQDPKIAAKRAELSELEAERISMRREHVQELESDLAEYERLKRAVERSQKILVPLAQEKVNLALSSYRSGKADLGTVVQARRELVEARLKAIDFIEQQALTSARLHFAYGEHQ